MAADDEELFALRKRAYGPDADIHLDAPAVDRLRALEARGHLADEGEPRLEAQPAARDEALEEAAVRAVSEPSREPIDPPSHPISASLGWLLGAMRWLSGIRRSTAVIALAVLVVAATLATVLVVVQRVQTDPLGVGATQVARLRPTTDYPVPVIFSASGFGSSSAAQAYQEFFGLRVVVTKGSGIYQSGATNDCLTVYPIDAISDPQSASASGPLIGGCAAGRFPAVAQFASDTEGIPADLRAKYGRATAMQFVYDRKNDEVVVFSSR